jgi:hypothetical protein
LKHHFQNSYLNRCVYIPRILLSVRIILKARANLVKAVTNKYEES